MPQSLLPEWYRALVKLFIADTKLPCWNQVSVLDMYMYLSVLDMYMYGSAGLSYTYRGYYTNKKY